VVAARACDVENGQRELEIGIEQARHTDAVMFAAAMTSNAV
jgi:hypothetical protein